MKKMKKILGSGGFTLVEVSTGLVILLSLILVSASIILFSGNMFIRNAILNDNKIIADNVCAYVTDKLTCAKDITVSATDVTDGDMLSDYYEQLSLTDGGTVFSISAGGSSPSEIYSAEELGGRAIRLRLSFLPSGDLSLAVALFNGGLGGEQLCELKRTIPLLNGGADYMTPELNANENTQYQSLYITYSYLD